MTLVELLVAMTVTTIVLVGITGVLYGVTSKYQQSIDRVGDASTGSALAAAIQADSHRYVVCQIRDAELDLCLPNSTMNIVTYTINPNGPPYSITRTEIHGSNQSSTLVGRGLFGQPIFWRDCHPTAGTLSGHIHVRWLRDPSRGSESFSVYYRAPLPQPLPDGCGQ
jgi:hypothetical protein